MLHEAGYLKKKKKDKVQKYTCEIELDERINEQNLVCEPSIHIHQVNKVYSEHNFLWQSQITHPFIMLKRKVCISGFK